MNKHFLLNTLDEELDQALIIIFSLLESTAE